MKKKIFGFMLVLMVGLLVPMAALASDIGYVDFELLFYAHPEYDAKNEELQSKVEELYGRLQEQAEALETQEEMDELNAFFQRQFDLIEQDVRVELVSFILDVIKEVAKANNVSAVLPESSIFYGGVNLTAPVVEAMYKVYGISVPTSIREVL